MHAVFSNLQLISLISCDKAYNNASTIPTYPSSSPGPQAWLRSKLSPSPGQWNYPLQTWRQDSAISPRLAKWKVGEVMLIESYGSGSVGEIRIKYRNCQYILDRFLTKATKSQFKIYMRNWWSQWRRGSRLKSWQFNW